MSAFGPGCRRAPVNLADIPTLRSYASAENLQRGLDKLEVGSHFHIKVCLPGGRWTAVFPSSNITGGYVALYASMGFFTLG